MIITLRPYLCPRFAFEAWLALSRYFICDNIPFKAEGASRVSSCWSVVYGIVGLVDPSVLYLGSFSPFSFPIIVF